MNLKQDKKNIEALVNLTEEMIRHDNPNMSEKDVGKYAYQMIENV